MVLYVFVLLLFFFHSLVRLDQLNTAHTILMYAIYIQSLYLCLIVHIYTSISTFVCMLHCCCNVVLNSCLLTHSFTHPNLHILLLFIFLILIFTIKFSVCTCEYDCRQFQVNQKITFSICAFFHAVCSGYFHTESGFMAYQQREAKKNAQNLMSLQKLKAEMFTCDWLWLIVWFRF